MYEIAGLFLIMLIFAALAFTPLGYFMFVFSKQPSDQLEEEDLMLEQEKIPEDSVLRRHFLTNLQSEIEASLFARPTDAVLQRHYDTLVMNEVKKRLEKMAS
ncbi:MAG: hypothetical protein ACU83N_06440 [Gammaproteobacteria bacterium]